MNIDQTIHRWAEMINESSLVLESKTPSDERSLDASFNGDVDGEKLVPTREFIEAAYEMLLDRLFQGENMPKAGNLIFNAVSSPTKHFVGTASYTYNTILGTVVPIAIKLNSALTLTLHEWIEVVLHEMVHIYDYVNNPGHFTGFERRTYNAHGSWFLNFGARFKKYGFNVQKYCNAEIGVNTDDKRMMKRMNDTVFIRFNGFRTKDGGEAVICIRKSQTDKYVDIISDKCSRGLIAGTKSLSVLKSDNSNVVRLSKLNLRSSRSPMKYYFFNEDFKRKYGPFEEIETLNMMTLANEDRDETEYGEMNRLDDRYARKIYDNVKGVVDVEKVDDGVYNVEIF